MKLLLVFLLGSILQFLSLSCNSQTLFHTKKGNCLYDSNSVYINPWNLNANDTLFESMVEQKLRQKFKRFLLEDSLIIVEYNTISHGHAPIEEYYLLFAMKNNELVKLSSYRMYFKKEVFNKRRQILKMKRYSAPEEKYIRKLIQLSTFSCKCERSCCDVHTSGVVSFILNSHVLNTCVLSY